MESRAALMDPLPTVGASGSGHSKVMSRHEARAFLFLHTGTWTRGAWRSRPRGRWFLNANLISLPRKAILNELDG